jgi:hypothetical protein
MKRVAISCLSLMKARRELINVAGGGLGPMSPRAACMKRWPALFTIASVVVGSECRKPSIWPVSSAGSILPASIPRKRQAIAFNSSFFSARRYPRKKARCTDDSDDTAIRSGDFRISSMVLGCSLLPSTRLVWPGLAPLTTASAAGLPLSTNREFRRGTSGAPPM